LTRADLDIQAVFLAGQNERLLQEAHEMAGVASFPVKVMACTDQIHHLMNASDIMVSKLGGLTTFEALACQLPIIGDCVTSPMPQEAQTARFIESKGTGLLLHRAEGIISVVESCMRSPSRLEDMRRAALVHAKAGAADRIAQGVLDQLGQNN
jgi:UDP-N-acetylglucosamine:LPS N-acetylglucosamine transferase